MENLYTTTALIRALDAMDRPIAFLRDTFFPNKVYSPHEEIAIDKLIKRKKMAPFVSPDVPAKERKLRGRTVETFQPATVKPLNTIRPNDLIKRAHGEAISGNLDPEARRALMINQTLLDQDDEITRTEEWMCAQAIRTGVIRVEGSDYETQIVDFQRPAEQTIVLTSGDRWGESGASIRRSLRQWATTTQKNSGGAVRPIILGTGAAELLQEDEDIREILDNRRQAGGGMQLGPLAGGDQETPYVYLGSLGQFDFFSYSQFFEDDDGNEIEVWPEYGVGLLAPSVFSGNMAYGAVLDMDSLEAVERYPKNFRTDNPSREHLMTQSAPLPVPSEVSGSTFALVR